MANTHSRRARSARIAALAIACCGAVACDDGREDTPAVRDAELEAEVAAAWVAGPVPADRVGISLASLTELELDGHGAPIDPEGFGLIHRSGWVPLEALLDGVDTEWLELSVDAAIEFRKARTICVVVNTPDACTLVCITVTDSDDGPTEPEPDGGD